MPGGFETGDSVGEGFQLALHLTLEIPTRPGARRPSPISLPALHLLVIFPGVVHLLFAYYDCSRGSRKCVSWSVTLSGSTDFYHVLMEG